MKNPKYIEIDNIYYTNLIIINYSREYQDLILKELIDLDENINISIFYEKQDQYKIIKQLTYYIGNNKIELNGNKENVELVASTYNDAKYIRKQMQINNEDLYYIYIYLTIYDKEIKNLEYILNKIEGISQSNGLETRRATFRQEQTFISSMPLMENNEEIKKVARRNILTNGVIATYPFISTEICDENGIYLGENIFSNSLIFLNIYKYKNSNMCIFGTSGAGKSYFTKLLIMRNSLLNIEQFIIDAEREYNILCENLDGTIIKIGPTSKTYINIFDIRENSIEENEGFLASKIQKLKGFFNLILNINEDEMCLLEEKIIECYKKKGITFEDKTLYKSISDKINIKPIFKESNDMPILEDLYKILDEGKIKRKLKPFVYGSMKFFNNYTNVELNKKIIVADIYELGEENIKYGMYLFAELFWDKIKENRNNKKIIYLDEIWRLIGVTSNKEVASFIFKIFKTIRKYGGGAVAITQDISDLFSLDQGVYGKSILNNTNIKIFFSLEEENIILLSKYTNISDKEKIDVKSLKRGECLMFIGENHILAKIDSANYEKKLIEEKYLLEGND